MTYPAAMLQAWKTVGLQPEIAAPFIRTYFKGTTEWVDSSDSELEQWFSRHRAELVDLTSHDVVAVAPWLAAIGPAINDNDPTAVVAKALRDPRAGTRADA